MGTDEWAVEKQRTKFMQHKSGLKCSQPVPRALFVVCVGLGSVGLESFLGSPAATSLGHLEVRNLMTGQAGLDSPDKLSSSKAPAGLQPCSTYKARGLSSPSSQRCFPRHVSLAPIPSLCPVLRGAVPELQPHSSSPHVADPW